MITNPWLVCNLPPGFKSHCPTDMDDHYYMDCVLSLINMAPNLILIDHYADSIAAAVESYHEESHEEYTWHVVDSMVGDAVLLWPYLRPTLVAVENQFPNGFDLYWRANGDKGNGIFIQLEEI